MSEGIHIRVDNRLLHGQVVQFWIPYFEIGHLIIADDGAASNPAMTSVYRMAIPKRVNLSVLPVSDLKEELEKTTSTSIMVLISEISDVVNALASGCDFKRVTLGNVHASDDRKRITDSVYLSPEELNLLATLKQKGCAVEIQTFPGEVLKMEFTDDGGTKWSKR